MISRYCIKPAAGGYRRVGARHARRWNPRTGLPLVLSCVPLKIWFYQHRKRLAMILRKRSLRWSKEIPALNRAVLCPTKIKLKQWKLLVKTPAYRKSKVNINSYLTIPLNRVLYILVVTILSIYINKYISNQLEKLIIWGASLLISILINSQITIPCLTSSLV